MIRRALVACAALACACGSGSSSGSNDDTGTSDAGGDVSGEAPDPSADWVIAIDPSKPDRAVSPALLGHYDLSGALFHYDLVPGLIDAMKSVGFAEWRVGVGRWEVATQLFDTLTDPTQSCTTFVSSLPADARFSGTDLDLLKARDWFVDDGAPVTEAMTNDDARYDLAYLRSVLDVAARFGASPYVDLDEMPRALSTNRTIDRKGPLDGLDPCQVSFANSVSNAPPSDPNVFAAAAVGLVKRIVEGSGVEAPRLAPYWEIWNEMELKYAWDYDFESAPDNRDRYFAMAILTLQKLDAYRTSSTVAAAKQLHFGLGSFAHAATAQKVIQAFDASPTPVPIDFISFHSYADDPMLVVADVKSVAAARDASSRYRNVEIALAEFGPDLGAGPPDTTMDRPLLFGTILAMGANLGLDRAHQSIFYDFYDGLTFGLLDHAAKPRPLFHAYALLHRAMGDGARRLAIASHDDGGFDAGQGAALAVLGSDGKTRVFVVNRSSAPKKIRVDLAGVTATAATVSSFDDPSSTPHALPSTPVVVAPPSSLLLLELQ